MFKLAGKRKRYVLTIETKLKVVERMKKCESVAVVARGYNIVNTVHDVI